MRKQKHVVLVGVIVVATVAAVFAMWLPSAEQRAIRTIDKANYCETPADCIQVGSKCPFGCYIYANKKEAERMTAFVDAYETHCTYSCMQNFGVECADHQCFAITTPDAGPGNVGAACTTSRDCETPVNYLVRSSCPFGSRCIDNTCAVVCPMALDTPALSPEEQYFVPCEQDADCDCDRFGEMGRCACVQEQCLVVVE